MVYNLIFSINLLVLGIEESPSFDIAACSTLYICAAKSKDGYDLMPKTERFMLKIKWGTNCNNPRKQLTTIL